jgi:hypothetical protein
MGSRTRPGHFPVWSNLDHAITASWFETRGVAALLTMRV